jgi:hypothetical protein
MMEGPGADSEEKQEPASDIDIAVVDSLKARNAVGPFRAATGPRTAACPEVRFRSLTFGGQPSYLLEALCRA